MLRIWDTTSAEHRLKYEYKVMGGSVADLEWTEDSKRIAVCGQGNDTFAHAIIWDSGMCQSFPLPTLHPQSFPSNCRL
jgi:hypothetical protein